MDRRSLLLRWSAIAASLLLAAVVAAGCKSTLQSLTLILNGTDAPAEWDGLKGKKVAVVCKPLTDMDFSNPGVDRALAERISERLKAKVKEIHIIDAQKVNELRDEKEMVDCIEIGKKLGAEKVVSVEIESFGVRENLTLLRGRATVSVRVYDVAEKNSEWHKSPLQLEYPRIGSTPAGDSGEEVVFRNKFVNLLAEQIARCFYAHDEQKDYGSDSDSIGQ